MLNIFDISISDIYQYIPPWIEMLVTPLVVVQIVGIDLLRELGFVMILWPADTFITVPVFYFGLHIIL